MDLYPCIVSLQNIHDRQLKSAYNQIEGQLNPNNPKSIGYLSKGGIC